MLNEQKIIILFDGVCNLCNGFVNFLIDQDTKSSFKFASLQSEFGEKVLRENDIQTDDYQSVVVFRGEELFTKSAAVFKIIELLPKWRWLRFFKVLPTFLLDGIYGVIARNRYRIFGKRDSCRLPTPELRERFLG